MRRFVRFITRPSEFKNSTIAPGAFMETHTDKPEERDLSLYHIPPGECDRLLRDIQTSFGYRDLPALCWIYDEDFEVIGLDLPVHKPLNDIPEAMRPLHFGTNLRDVELDSTSLAIRATVIARGIGFAKPFIKDRRRAWEFSGERRPLTDEELENYGFSAD